MLSQQSKYHPASSRPSSATNRGGEGSGAASVDSSSQLRPTFITPTEEGAGAGADGGTTTTTAPTAASPQSPMIPASTSPLSPQRRGSALLPPNSNTAAADGAGVSGGVTLMRGADCDPSARRISVTSTLMRSASSQSLHGSIDSGGGGGGAHQGPRPPSATRSSGVAVATDFIRRIRSRGSLKSQASMNYDE